MDGLLLHLCNSAYRTDIWGVFFNSGELVILKDCAFGQNLNQNIGNLKTQYLWLRIQQKWGWCHYVENLEY